MRNRFHYTGKNRMRFNTRFLVLAGDKRLFSPFLRIQRTYHASQMHMVSHAHIILVVLSIEFNWFWCVHVW